jgi:hypothetical protein
VGRIAWTSELVKCIVPVYPTAVFPYASLAITVVANDAPVVVAEGATTCNALAAAALTVVIALPVIDGAAVSLTELDSGSAVFNVIVKVCAPASIEVNV